MKKTKDSKQGIFYIVVAVVFAAIACTAVLSNILSTSVFMQDRVLAQSLGKALNKFPRFITKDDLAEIKFLSIIQRQDSSTSEVKREVAIGYDDAIKYSLSTEETASEDFQKSVKVAAYTQPINSFADLQYFPNAVQLQIENQPALTSTDDIVKMSSLTGLMLSNVGIGDYTALATMPAAPGLDTLYLNSAGIKDVSILSGMTSLRILSLAGNGIENIAPLGGMTKLETVYLPANKISDLSPMAAWTVLEDLNLQQNEVSDLSPLGAITTLKTANVSYNNISDISALAGKAEMTNVNLAHNKISDISPLAGAKKMVTFEAGNNEISDIAAVKDMTGLQYLLVPSNKVVDISPIKGLAALWYVDFTSNNVTDVSVMKDMTALIYGSVEDNEITDFAPIDAVANRMISGKGKQKADLEAEKAAQETTEAASVEETTQP